MIVGVVLAAGESRRMGKQKLLLPYGGVPVIRHIANVLGTSELGKFAVVTGKDKNGVEECLAGTEALFTHNAEFDEGMLSSVRKAVGFAASLNSDLMLFLGDQPMIEAVVINELMSGWNEKVATIRVASFHGRRGHPVLIHQSFFDEILTEFDDQGLRGLLVKRASQVFDVHMNEEGVLMDMDFPSDYEAALKRLEKNG